MASRPFGSTLVSLHDSFPSSKKAKDSLPNFVSILTLSMQYTDSIYAVYRLYLCSTLTLSMQYTDSIYAVY